jgi:hypothetical protein
MKKICVGLLSLVIVALLPVRTLAWSSGNRWGGSTQHSVGSTSHENAWGGSTQHVAGEGTSHTNVYGGSATHYEGGGWSKTGAYGGTAYATLPAGCIMPKVQGTTYYLCGNTWFQPAYGANGVYYRVVPTP